MIKSIFWLAYSLGLAANQQNVERDFCTHEGYRTQQNLTDTSKVRTFHELIKGQTYTDWHRDKIIFSQNHYSLASSLKEELFKQEPEEDEDGNPDAEFQKYDPGTLPIFSTFYSSPELPVGIHFRLMEVSDLDTYDELKKVVYTLQLFWYDPRLAWYKPDFTKNVHEEGPKIFKQVTNSDGKPKSLKDFQIDDVTVAFHLARDNRFNSESSSIQCDQYSELIDYILNVHKTRPLLAKEQEYMSRIISREEYHEVTFIQVSAKEIWTPDVTVYNERTGKHYNYKTNEEDHTRCTVFSDGLVIWEPIISHTVSCDMDLNRFPFDVQMCALDFGSWYYSAANLKLILANVDSYKKNLKKKNAYLYKQHAKIDDGFSEGPITTYDIMEASTNLNHGEWGFVAAGLRVGKGSTKGRSWVRFYVMLKRNPINYMLNVFFTCILMALSAGVAICIPAGSDRLNLIFAILITMAVYQMITADMTPAG